jgi:hypothetical protein
MHQGARCIHCKPFEFFTELQGIYKKLNLDEAGKIRYLLLGLKFSVPESVTAGCTDAPSDDRFKALAILAETDSEAAARRYAELEKDQHKALLRLQEQFLQWLRTINNNYRDSLPGINRKNILRVLRKGRERWENIKDDPACEAMPRNSRVQRATEEAEKRALCALDGLPVFIKHPLSQHYTRIVKPSKGQEGRDAAKGATTKRKLTKQEQAVELHRQNPELTHAEIGERIARESRTVRRYLNGR